MVRISISSFLCIAFLISVICACSILPVMAISGSETRITTNSADQLDPAISGSYIVYTDGRNANKDIYLYDLVSKQETDLTSGTPNDQYLDDVDGSHVVYTNVGTEGSDIYLFDTTTSSSTPLTSGGSQYSPAVQGDSVVWASATSSSQRVMLANIKTWKDPIVIATATVLYSPRVDGDWVVWEEVDASYSQIHAYQISTGTSRQITTDASDHRRPDVSGDTVVWAGNSSGNWDIFTYSLGDGVTTQLTYDKNDQQYARISGKRIVWEDGRSGTTQIWTEDLDEGLEEPLSPSAHPQILNNIDGNHVVWTESRYGNFDIFMFTINPPPVARADAFSTDEDTVLTVAAPGVLANDNDPDGDPITAIKVTGPSHGTVTLNADGSFTYTPATGFTGTDSFTYKANDGSGDSPVAPVTITVSAANHAPVASGQAVSTNENTAKEITMAATDADGDLLSYFIVSNPAHGTLGPVSPADVVTYTPATGYVGSDSFTFKANDGTADSDVATVTITVNAVNHPPVANAGVDQNVNVGSVVTLDGSGSSDPDGNAITYAWSMTSKPAGSTAMLSGATARKPAFTADKAGQYIIQLIVNDGTVNSDPDTVTITATQTVTTVPVDVEPGFCPNVIGVNMKGPILVVAIAGTSDLDAAKIDPATIKLSREGVSATVSPRLSKVLDIATAYTPTSTCGCVRKLWDGKKDLVLVFDIGEVATKLNLKDAVGISVPLTISGNLKSAYGSNPISGTDCAKILSICNDKIGLSI